MPELRVNGVRLYYEDRGRGEQTVVFSHGLLWSTALFEPQMEALEGRHRIVAWDHRGQGRSESPDERAHQIESCYHDALALIEALGLGPVHFVGLSMGGFVGMRLAARHPELVRSLSLLATAADPEPEANVGKYGRLNLVARALGVGAVAGKVLPIMFGDTFLTDPARAEDRELWTGRLKGNDRTIYRAVRGVVERCGVTDELQNIRCPTLMLHGDEDKAIIRSRARATAQRIPNCEFMPIPAGGHSMTVENPQAVNAALGAFIDRVVAS